MRLQSATWVCAASALVGCGVAPETRSTPTAVDGAPSSAEALDAALQEALRNLTDGRLDDAAVKAGSFLREHRDDPVALFLLACVALEQKDWTKLDAQLATLAKAVPAAPEVGMLAALEKAARTGANAWTAFANAWISLGRPNWQTTPILSKLFLAEVVVRPEEGPPARWRDEPARWFAVLGSQPISDPDRSWLLQQIPKRDEPADLRAAADALLNGRAPPDSRSRAFDALVRRIDELESAGRADGSLALIRLVGLDTEAPLEPADISKLEALAGRTFSSTGLGATSRRAQQALEPPRGERALYVAWTYAVAATASGTVVDLRRRVKVSAGKLSAADQARLGKALWTLGGKVAEGRSLLERLVGLALQKLGTNLDGDAGAGAAVDAEVKRVRLSISAGNTSAVERWPLPTLAAAARADQIDDEAGHYARLAP